MVPAGSVRPAKSTGHVPFQGPLGNTVLIIDKDFQGVLQVPEIIENELFGYELKH